MDHTAESAALSYRCLKSSPMQSSWWSCPRGTTFKWLKRNYDLSTSQLERVAEGDAILVSGGTSIGLNRPISGTPHLAHRSRVIARTTRGRAPSRNGLRAASLIADG